MKDVLGLRLGGPTVGNLRLLGVSSGIFVVVSETEISNTVCRILQSYSNTVCKLYELDVHLLGKSGTGIPGSEDLC